MAEGGKHKKSHDKTDTASRLSPKRSRLAQARNAFALPAPIKRLFDATPLITYERNAKLRDDNKTEHDKILHVFSTDDIATEGHLSHNPSCLKWQTLLTLSGVTFVMSASTNHASPSGSLPYLEVRHNDHDAILSHIMPATELPKFLRSQAAFPRTVEVDSDSQKYLTLLDTQVRLAYIYCLYLEAKTFERVAVPLYVEPLSRNRFVRYCKSYSLREAAMHEVTTNIDAPLSSIQPEALLTDARESFGILSERLGKARWFSTQEATTSEDKVPSPSGYKPGGLDAAVFAYTHVILTIFTAHCGELAKQLYLAVSEQADLVRHHDELLAHLTETAP